MKLKYPYFWQKNSVISLLLIPLSWIFSLLAFLRQMIATPISIGKFVICVGNITSGGTGKTQIIKWLANYLAEKEISYVIITKGYGGSLKEPVLVTKEHDARYVGDESLELLPFGRVIAAPDIRQAKNLIDNLSPQLILVDDGMQNPWFNKDLCILTIDSSRSIGNGRIIPAGPLRESIHKGLRRANLVFTVGNTPLQDKKLLKQIETHAAALFSATITPITDIDLAGRFLAFAAIGNPARFHELLIRMGLDIAEFISFPDHHSYSRNELVRLKENAKQSGARLITTRKDAVKLPPEFLEQVEVLDVGLDFAEEENNLRSFLDERLTKES